MADEAADVAELLVSGKGSLITGGEFLLGGATTSFSCGPLKPEA